MNTMTPSRAPVTEGQIGKLKENIYAKLLKNKDNLPSNIFQEILGDKTLLDDIHTLVEKRVKALNNECIKFEDWNGMLICKLKGIKHDPGDMEKLKAMERCYGFINEVVKSMPHDKDGEAEVRFFRLGYSVGLNELQIQYQLRGLKPADPFLLAAVNKFDPTFCRDYPNGTQWRNNEGFWCTSSYGLHSSSHGTQDQKFTDFSWNNNEWFAGIYTKQW